MFEKIISLENLFAAWKEFKRGKMRKADVQEFNSTLEENLFELHALLKTGTYCPKAYFSFFVSDPKLRHIHKATVRDRVVHQALFRQLYFVFDRTFIHDSYSCRLGKGTHKGVEQLRRYGRKASANHRKPAYALKGDIRKFFESIDHPILTDLLKRRIDDLAVLGLLELVIRSYEKEFGKGLPLGNVTSQLFANIYLNEFDQWAKHVLKAKYYLRYCDDFIILHSDRKYLESIVPRIAAMLRGRLRLELHPKKISIRKISQGVDFLGYVVLPCATMLRTRTKRRMLRNLNEKNLPSYLGMLKHANTEKLRKKVLSRQ